MSIWKTEQMPLSVSRRLVISRLRDTEMRSTNVSEMHGSYPRHRLRKCSWQTAAFVKQRNDSANEYASHQMIRTLGTISGFAILTIANTFTHANAFCRSTR